MTIAPPINAASPVNWQCSLNRGLQAWLLAMPGNRNGTAWKDITRKGHDVEFVGGQKNLTKWNDRSDRPGSMGSMGWPGKNQLYPRVRSRGSNDFISGIGTTATSPFGFSVWLIVNTLEGGGHGIFGVGQFFPNFTFTFGGPGHWGMFWGDVKDSGDVFPIGFWQHLLWTKDTNGDIHMYRNGIAKNVVSDSNIWVDDELQLASSRVGRDTEFGGAIDDWRCWNRYLPPKDAKALYLDSIQDYRRTLNHIDYTMFYGRFAESNLVKTVNDAIQIAETVEQHRAIRKIINDAIQIAETVEQHRAIRKIINDAIQIIEDIKKRQALTRLVNEAIQVVETTVDLTSVSTVSPPRNIDIVLPTLNVDVVI